MEAEKAFVLDWEGVNDKLVRVGCEQAERNCLNVNPAIGHLPTVAELEGFTVEAQSWSIPEGGVFVLFGKQCTAAVQLLNICKGPEVYGHRVKICAHTSIVPNNEHQYRSRKKTKELLVEKVSTLLAHEKEYKSFEDIYSEVSSILVEGRHPTHLMAYDISLRIGARNGISPDEFVYLHAVTLDGAKKLKEHLYPNFPIQTPRIETAKIKEIVKEFEDYTAYDIEHFLCVYHKQL